MSANSYQAQVEEAASFLRARVSSIPRIAIVLGTGLDDLSARVEVNEEISFGEIPNFPVSTVQSHEGSLLIGTLNNVPVIIMRGRVHLYEGYSASEVTLPVRVLALCGVSTLVLSNACGGMNKEYRSGDLVLIKDHINMMGQNPLEGPNVDAWGPRFPDMSDPYSESLRTLVKKTANDVSIPLHEGVYISVVGPNLETRAEYTMLRFLGADVVGMSTVPEVLVARHMGLNVLAFSVVTDECFPEVLQPISLEDVLRAAKKASPKLIKLIELILPQI
ncbi:purine-nucleoside phosphorylase [bacterium]|nr:purine-nucleoside phosphorylase [bacterium]